MCQFTPAEMTLAKLAENIYAKFGRESMKFNENVFGDLLLTAQLLSASFASAISASRIAVVVVLLWYESCVVVVVLIPSREMLRVIKER